MIRQLVIGVFQLKEIEEMKTLLMILVVVVVALVAFNYLTTGELKLLPGDSMSEAGHEVNSLRGEFRDGGSGVPAGGQGRWPRAGWTRRTPPQRPSPRWTASRSAS